MAARRQKAPEAAADAGRPRPRGRRPSIDVSGWLHGRPAAASPDLLGKVFVFEVFLRACASLGISVEPARPAHPDRQGDRRAITNLFCQQVAG